MLISTVHIDSLIANLAAVFKPDDDSNQMSRGKVTESNSVLHLVNNEMKKRKANLIIIIIITI